MTELKRLTGSRKYIRKCITEHYNRRDTFDALSLTDKQKLKLQLEKWVSEIRDLNGEILSLQYDDWEETEQDRKLEAELKVCQEYDNKLFTCIVAVNSSVTVQSSQDVRESARSLLKSPVAPLPKYNSTDEEDLVRFFHEFEETISKFGYPEYDKLLLLKQNISGRALVLVNSLETDKQGYTHAKELLLKALASDDTRRFNVLRQLTRLKFSYGREPFEFISKVRLITESFKKLDIKVEHVQQFFIWEAINEDFQNHLVQITNTTKPTLTQINENFFDAAERYVSQLKQTKANSKSIPRGQSDVSVSSLAVDVHYDKSKSFKPCSLCTKMEGQDAAHPIYKCSKYPSAAAKVDEIKILKGCVKCSNLSHETKSCSYRFNHRCRQCSGWHFGFLCVKHSESEGSKSKLENKSLSSKEKIDSKVDSSKAYAKGNTKKQEGITGCVMAHITEALSSDVDIGSLLPTFTCVLEEKLKVRCLKDSGSQMNFISSALADQLTLRTVKDHLPVMVNGINGSQQYDTRIVEVKIDVGDKSQIIQALILPSINIKLCLPDLGKVVKGFRDRGYVLADEYLGEDDTVIDGIDFILSNKSGFCLPQKEHVFGEMGYSLYSETSAGVLLHGNVEQILSDLPYLPYNNSSFKGDLHLHDKNLLQNVLASRTTCFVSDLTLEDSLSPLDFNILDSNGEVIESQLEKATSQILENSCSRYINLADVESDAEDSELNVKLVKYALENMCRNEEGRIIVPLLWNSKVSHLLGHNQGLTRLILQSNLKKLLKNKMHLMLMDQVFKEQEASGILERIDDLDQFLIEHPNHSFLPHTGVFKLDRDTTKCRVVFLSNLFQKKPGQKLTVSHNQSIYPGPTLNQKIVSSLLHLRFGSHLLCFDICKAFNNLALNEVDSNRLLCLWYRNVEKGDFTVVGYRNLRLSFGLRCSPCLLILALYKILVLDGDLANERLVYLKKLLYQLCYMDNLAVAYDTSSEINWAYQQLRGIFEPYKFYLQQFLTNDLTLQDDIDSELKVVTKDNVKLLGLTWNRQKDCLMTRPINLDENAATKRNILSSIASQYDLYNFNGPLLNRSRLFLHDLQCNPSIGWDEVLSKDLLRNWKNIARQANSAPVIEVSRFVGSRKDSYKLLAFADSSKSIYGVVVFIQNIFTGDVNFVLAKNRIVGKNMTSKSIPSLELQGVALSVECLVDIYEELAGPNCISPINIVGLQVFSDSMVVLSWLHSYSIKLEKLQKLPVFVKNRLHKINELCDKHSVSFSFVSGENNPADCISRCMSHKLLIKSNYFCGPDFLRDKCRSELSMQDTFSFVLPNPNVGKPYPTEEVQVMEATVSWRYDGFYKDVESEHVQTLSRISSFRKVILTYRTVMIFLNKLKVKVKEKNPKKYEKLEVFEANHNFFAEARKLILLRDQKLHFPEVFDYFNSSKRLLKDLPTIVGQLNIYKDSDGLLRVHSKLEKLKDKQYRFPLLLSKDSKLTRLVILHYHKIFSHCGCYSLLSEIRKSFWIPRYFSTVKKVIRSCVICRRFNERTIKLNQSQYRDFRVNPPEIPFRYIYVDYMGPFTVRSNNDKKKVWLLCLTCAWSRAVNLKLCYDLSVKEYLRAFQIHCFEFGMPEVCISDMGTQLVAGGNMIKDFLKDPEVKLYLEENGMKFIRFEHYFKGNSALGSLVESCVKLTKRLLFGAIRNNVLQIRDFEFLTIQTVHLVNRRPIAFRESLRETDLNQDLPEAITPECLIRGYNLISLNIIPDLQRSPDSESDNNFTLDPVARIKDNYNRLRNVRSKLIDLYHGEFLTTLTQQAVNVKGRYTPVKHTTLQKNDIVLIKEPLSKPAQYPMAIVRDVVYNDLGEVTGAVLCKGKTKEITKRHVSGLIFLLRPNEVTDDRSNDEENVRKDASPLKKERKAAQMSRVKTAKILQDG